MNITIDTSVIIAVIINEPEKPALIKASLGADLLAPTSVHWEIGNAFSAMFKRNRINAEQASACIQAYRQIPLRFIDVNLEDALGFAERFNIYAYDAYLLVCAEKYKAPLLSLDKRLLDVANQANIQTIQGML